MASICKRKSRKLTVADKVNLEAITVTEDYVTLDLGNYTVQLARADFHNICDAYTAHQDADLPVKFRKGINYD